MPSANFNRRPLVEMSAARCAASFLFAALLAGNLPAQQAAPQYSISVPSFDEIPADAIPPAPAPAKRQPAKPAPVAKSPEEAAAFEKIGSEQRPDQRIKLVEDFLLAYPQSEFRQAVYLAASEARSLWDDKY